MAYQVIEQIKVGTNPQGKAWGGFIYSANMSVGYSSATTQLILNIMSPTNDYTISDSDLKVNTAPTLIKVGDINVNMFLYAYTKNRTADGGTVLNVTYVDQSINLDRVFIGLANEHTRKNINSIVLAGAIPITCESCNGSTTPRAITQTIRRQVDSYGLNLPASTTEPFTGELILGQFGAKQSVFHYGQGGTVIPLLIITVNGTSAALADASGSNLVAPTAPTIAGFDIIASLTTTRVISYYGWGATPNGTDNPAFAFGNIERGGFIGLGTEEFSQSTCSSGAVTYSLKELKEAIKDFGFLIETVPGTSTETIPDGYDDLRRNYSGTLRSVLQNWGNDYGFDFSYDFTSNKIIGINLRQAITDIETIKDRIKNSDSLTNYAGSPVVETLEESASLAGTYRKYHSTIYRKDARVRNYSKTIYNQARFSPLRLRDVMTLPNDPRTGNYATWDQFYISCILATISKNLWFYYNFKKINSFGVSPVTDLGLKAKYTKKAERLNGTTGQYDIEVLQVAVGTFKDFLDKVFQAQESLGRNFINQQYINFQYTPVKNKYCAGDLLDIDFNAHFSDSVETFYKQGAILPNSKPSFSKLGGEIYSKYFHPVSTLTANYVGYYRSLTVNAVNFYSRQGIYNNNYDLSQLNTANQNYLNFSDLPIDPTDIKKDVNDKVEYFAVKANTVVISIVADSINPSEQQAVAVPTSNNSCRLYCEQDFVSEICDFNRCLGVGQRSDQEWPKGLIPNNGNLYGDTIRIAFTNPNGTQAFVFNITTPSYAPYQSNFIYQFNNRYVMPGAKKVLAGEIDSTAPSNSDYPQNVEAVDFSTADVTSDIDTFFDSTNNQVVTNVLMPNNGLMTVENYDTELRNTALATASVSNLRKTFRFSVPGMLNSSFSDILTPAKGLLGFDINFDDKGLTTTYNYATRPPKPPQKEMVFNRISPSFARR